MTKVHAHPLRSAGDATSMLGATAVPDVYHLIQQDPIHLDLSHYPHALSVHENVDCLSAHLLQFGAIESLNLAGMRAGPAVVDSFIIATEVGGATQLTSLNLRDSQLSAVQFIRMLRPLGARAPHLAVLDISDNALGDGIVEALAAWLPPSLQVLRLAGNSLSAGAVTALMVALTATKPAGLAAIDLTDNHVDAATCAALHTLLTTTTCQTTLKELRLAHCGLDEANSPLLADGLHGSAVEVLDVSRNDCLLSFIFAVEEGRAVSFPTSLRSLNLSDNPCKRVAVGGLVEALRGCGQGLEELYLHHTFHGDATLSAFLCGVSFMRALRVLDLSACGLTYRSGKMLGQQLPMHPQLAWLRLSDNMLEVEGVMDLASALERLVRLTTLEVAACNLGNCGATAVVTCLLRSCAPVEQLDLSDNAVNDAGLRDVCTLLSRLTCPRLQWLDISKNAVTKASQVNLVEMMQGRQALCQVVALDTPLDEVASSSPSSVDESTTNSLRDW